MIAVVLQGKAMNEQQEVPGVVPSAASFSHLHDRSTFEPRCRREKSCGHVVGRTQRYRLRNVVTNQELQRVGCAIAKVGEKCDEILDVGGTWERKGETSVTNTI